MNKILRELVTQFYKNHNREYDTLVQLIKAFKNKYPEIKYGAGNRNLQEYFSKLRNGEVIGIKSYKEDIINEKTIEENGNERRLEGKVNKQITSLEQAIEFFEVDLKEWEVINWKCKSWDTSMKLEKIDENGKKTTTPITKTNYLVNVNLKRRNTDVNYDKIFKHIDNWVISPRLITTKGNDKVGVLVIADLHAGLKANKENGLVAFPDYDIKTLLSSLVQIAQRVNELNYKKLHVVCLGDIVESVTGYNHMETLKEMEFGLTGGNIIIAAYEMLNKFISSLFNVEEVYLISGNHDRLAGHRKEDIDGGASRVVSYMLNKTVPTKWHPVLINTIIDNISYILTHGDLKMNKQDMGKIVLQYGKQDLYNVILQAHVHHRKVRRVVSEREDIIIDTQKYRMITVSSIVTPNRWTESMGFGSTPGFTLIEANSSKDNINHLDFSLSRLPVESL